MSLETNTIVRILLGTRAGPVSISPGLGRSRHRAEIPEGLVAFGPAWGADLLASNTDEDSLAVRATEFRTDPLCRNDTASKPRYPYRADNYCLTC
jgi:hypothetical protein